MMVGKNLDFEVPRAWQIFFQKDGGIAEGGARFTLGFFQKVVELRGVVNDAHASAADLTGFSVPGRTGTPAEAASLRAAVLSPSNSRRFGGGPTKVMPAFSQARAKAGFSDRKP